MSLMSRRQWLAATLSLPVLPLHAQPAEPIRLALIEGLSGPFGNAGEAVFRNLLWATERINAQALALGIERPKLRNQQAITNQNTLIYALINLRALRRLADN